MKNTVMMMNEEELDMVAGGYSIGEFWSDAKKWTDKVTDYVPVVREMKDYVKDMNKCNSEIANAGSSGEKWGAFGKGMFRGLKHIGKGIFDACTFGGETLVETAFDVADDMTK